jgi:Leucine-rich repeat (LRR) protein
MELQNLNKLVKETYNDICVKVNELKVIYQRIEQINLEICNDYVETIIPNYESQLYIPSTFTQQLTEMPDLSNYKNLKILKIDNHKIKDLGLLPDTLEELYCYGNGIANFDNLPPNLKVLKCGSNYVKSLDNLPSSLKLLECTNTLITSLDNLPYNLEYLDCYGNNISSLDNLPPGLKKINCGCNNLKTLNNLPHNLIKLECHYNTELHLDNIPITVKELLITGIASANIVNNNIAIYR